MTLTMRIRLLTLAVAVSAVAAPASPDDTKREQVPAPRPAPPQPTLLTPTELPPTITRRTVRGRMMLETPPPAASAGELAGLRAVALREGAADVSLDGAARKLKVGDALGSGTVRAIGADRIVIERPFSVPGGAPSRATVIVTFGTDGVPRVRTIVGVAALPQPFEEAR